MPFDLEKRHIRTMGSSHDISVFASAFAGLCSNWRISARNLGSILLARSRCVMRKVKKPLSVGCVIL